MKFPVSSCSEEELIAAALDWRSEQFVLLTVPLIPVQEGGKTVGFLVNEHV